MWLVAAVVAGAVAVVDNQQVQANLAALTARRRKEIARRRQDAVARAVKALLAHGANANDIAPDGTSALNVAVVNACFEVAAALLNHGADPNAPDARGSALHTLAWLRKPGSDGGNGLGKRSWAPPLPTGNMSALELAKAFSSWRLPSTTLTPPAI